MRLMDEWLRYTTQTNELLKDNGKNIGIQT